MAELYDALQKSMLDPIMGLGIGLMSGRNMGAGLQQGLSNAQSLQAQQFRQNAAIEEMLNRAEYLRLANEEAQQKRAAAQAKQQERQQNMQTYGMYDPTARALETSTMTDAQGMPLRPGMPGWNEQMERGPGVVVNTGTSMQPPGPPPEPGATYWDGKSWKHAPKSTEAESKSANFADRMITSSEAISAMPDFDPASLSTRLLQAGPNFLRSDEMQVYNTAKDAWIRAHLRKESGAVIGDQEQIDEENTYFPQVGDSADVIEFKEKLRKREEESYVKAAGKAYQPRAGQQAQEAPASPQAGDVVDGYEFLGGDPGQESNWRPVQ